MVLRTLCIRSACYVGFQIDCSDERWKWCAAKALLPKKYFSLIRPERFEMWQRYGSDFGIQWAIYSVVCFFQLDDGLIGMYYRPTCHFKCERALLPPSCRRFVPTIPHCAVLYSLTLLCHLLMHTIRRMKRTKNQRGWSIWVILIAGK